MRVCVKASKDSHWQKSGNLISYKPSRLNDTQEGQERSKKYFELSFSYDFKHKDDKVYFAYCFPYTFSKLSQHLRLLVTDEKNKSFLREEHFCYSLSGVSVPILTITSNIDKVKEQGSPVAIQPEDFKDQDQVPVNKYKKHIIMSARVHPGESVASFIMEGFLNFITGSSQEAVELRRNVVFKVIPMMNPDGVITGNYRSSLSGNDLNRQFIAPNPKLHPEVY